VRPGLASACGAISGHGSAACSVIRPAAMVEPDAFAQLLAYVEKETQTLKVLRCKTLKDCEVWTVKCEVWSVKCGLGRVQCELRSVKC